MIYQVEILELKDAMNKMKNARELQKRLNQEELICKLEDRSLNIIHSEEKNKNEKERKKSLCELWDNVK